MKAPVRVAVTGAAGQIGYALLFRIASGEMLGKDQPVILHCVEIPPALEALKGWKFDSPRGPIMIDPATRDIVMNEYLSEVILKDGRLHQKVIGKIENVKDVCKEQKIGPCAN